MAEEVLSKANEIRMKHNALAPDIFTYNSIIHAYLKDWNHARSLEKILDMVEYMDENKVEQPLISPDCFTYHCVLRAWSKVNDADAAEHAVQTVEKMHTLWESGDQSLKPETAFYNMAINKSPKVKEM